MSDYEEKIKAELNEICVIKVFECIQEHGEHIKDIPPADILVSVCTSVVGNLIQSFISEEASNKDRHAACCLFLSAVEANVKRGFDEVFGVESEVKETLQ
jgi:hypothetical protein